MKKRTWSSHVLICALALILSCKVSEKKRKPVVVFSGTITGVAKGDGVPGVQLNGGTVHVGTDGAFKAEVDSAGTYVLSISKRGYTPITKVYHRSVKDKRYALRRITTRSFNPRQGTQVTDDASDPCSGSDLARIKWNENFFRSVPLVVNASGQLIDFGFPSSAIKDLFTMTTSSPLCNAGATVSIPPNSIIGPNNSPVPGTLMISVSTIDLRSPDEMPGDYSFVDQESRRSGYLISMGAVNVQIYDREGNEYRLNGKSKAHISVPVDPLQLQLKNHIPDTIPLLSFNEETALWEHQGEAFLNRERNAYEADVVHFSTFNMDMEKYTPTCIRFRQVMPRIKDSYIPAVLSSGSTALSYPSSVSETHVTEIGDCYDNVTDDSGYNVLYNLDETATEFCVVFYDYDPTQPAVPKTNFRPYGVYVIKTTGNTYTPSAPGAAPLCKYDSNNCYELMDVLRYANDNLIATAQGLSSGGALVKWIYNEAPPISAPRTFDFFKCESAGLCSSTKDYCVDDGNLADDEMVDTIEITYTGADDPRLPIRNVGTVSGLTSGDYFLVRVREGTSGVICSQIMQVQ